MDHQAESTYLSYQAMISQTNESMASLSNVCKSLGMDDYARTLDLTRARMKEKVFSVGIMGEFKRGKSTVINALLGQEIVPADILPTSATLNYIRWDAKPSVTVHFRDGMEKEISIDELPDFVTKLTPEAEQMAATVDDAVVYYPCRFCQNGVQIVDTPGLNDDERMNEISERVIPTLDAIIMVVTPDSPFSASEANFVRSKIMTSDLGRIIFVVNKIDNIRKKDRVRILQDIRGRIQVSILEKTASVYGIDSEEYAETERKLGGIRVFGISALDALEGRLEGDEELVQQSGFLEFENALSKLLTEERGMLELIGPVNTVLSVAKEAGNTINMRRNALKLEKDKVEAIAAEGMEKVEKERDRKTAAVSETRKRASMLYASILPQLVDSYSTVEEEMLSAVNEMSISPELVDNDKKMVQMGERLEKQLKDMIMEKLCNSTERLLVEIEKQVSEELLNLQKLSEEIHANITEIGRKLAPSSDNNMFEWGVAAFDTLTSFVGVVGIGGIITGWKENGVAGAAVGGLAGFLAGTGSIHLIGLLAGAVGVGAGGLVVAIPAIAIGGIASAFVGKAAVRRVFHDKVGERNVKKLRSSLNQAVRSSMQEIRNQRVLENWLKATTSSIYNTIADQLDQEIEAALKSFESTLSSLRLDKQKNESDIEKTLEDLSRYTRRLEEIASTINPVKKKLADSLN